MPYTFFAICAYILMRAFEVLFEHRKDEKWYRITVACIAIAVLYCAVSGMLVLYFEDLKPLGFSAK